MVGGGLVGILQFQSTLSMRRATWACAASQGCSGISIHALHEESDKEIWSYGLSG